MKKTLRTGKKVCSVFLAVLMVLTAWVFVAPEKAEAATAGQYYYKVTFQVTDDMDNVQMKSTLYGRGNNGTSGSEVTIATKNYTSDTKFSGTITIMEGTTDAGVFPTRFHIYDNNGAKYFMGRNLKGYWHVYVGSSSSNLTEVYLNGIKNSANVEKMEVGSGKGAYWYWEVRNIWVGGKTNTFNVDYNVSSDDYPKASSTSISGGSTSLTVPTTAGGSVSSNAFKAGTVYDQYGVAWYQDATLSADKSDKVNFSGGEITVTNAKSNASADYNVTVTAKCGDASKTATCKIVTFDYKATFKDYNGTVLKAEQTVDYGGTATKPSNPTRSPDSTHHYTFTDWSPTVAALTSGAQTVTYTAQYTAAGHSYTSSVETEATCTEKGTSKYTCSSCGYSYTSQDIAALGHSYNTKDTSSTYLKSAATCTDAAVYYYKCDRCTAKAQRLIQAVMHSATAGTQV